MLLVLEAGLDVDFNMISKVAGLGLRVKGTKLN